MKTFFRLEVNLVDTFVSSYIKDESEVLVTELPIRFGNIDVVSIKNISLPFSKKQIEILSNQSAALVFTKVKNERPVSRKTLFESLGLSKSTIDHTLYALTSVGLIEKNERGLYLRKIKFVFPKTVVTGYEAKLKNFNKAFYQAKKNKAFVDYSYLVFPIEIANNFSESKKKLLISNGIGLIGVSCEKNIQILKARKSSKMSNHIRLLNLAKVNVYIN